MTPKTASVPAAPKTVAAKTQPAPAPAKAPVSENVLPQAKAAGSDQVTYSVQVGAFRVRREAEIRAKEVRAQGFDCRIELPDSADGFYLIKIGRFASRSEASAEQSRLKKLGINSFIKIN